MKPKSRSICTVPQCHSYARNGVSLHKFPKDVHLAKKWAAILRIDKPLSKYMLVCSLHFKENDFHPTTPLKTKKVLKKNVIPSCDVPLRKYNSKKNDNARSDRLENPQKNKEVKRSNDEEEDSLVETTVLPFVERETISSSLDVLAEVCAAALRKQFIRQ